MKSRISQPNEEPRKSRPSEVYVRPLSPEEQEWVHRLYQQTTHVGLKSRCHIIMRGFSKQGHQRKIETPRQNKKQYGAGLIHWMSGQLCWTTSEHKDNALFRSVLTQLLATGNSEPGRKKSIVVDNYRIHFAKLVQAFLAEHQEEIELVCLPTYSPKLNPVERFWKHLRRQVTHNHFFQTMERLMDAVTSFFRDMADSPDLVRSVVGLAA